MRLLFILLTLLVARATQYDDFDFSGDDNFSREEEEDVKRLPKFLKMTKPHSIVMSEDRLAAALNWARQKVAGYKELERQRDPRSTSKIGYHRASFDAATQREAREALAWVEVAKAAYAGRNFSDWEGAAEKTMTVVPSDWCSGEEWYRRLNGSCNNPLPGRSLWGASDTPLIRLAPPTFEDGINEPRRLACDGSPLRSAREISQGFTGSVDDANNALTLSVVNWGQFMDHDITLSPPFLTEDGAELDCCTAEGEPVADAHPQCLPITIPDDDPFYGPLGQRCMEFARSVPAAGQLGATITKNVLTAFIDGSGVYGSRDSRAALVRSYSGGRLERQSGDLLPPDPPGIQIETEQPCFSPDESTMPCFLAGDVRATEQSGLATMHTIWMREHNRIADALAGVRPNWGDERLFQEARKIVGAELQHIAYNEWLPLLLGEDIMELMDMATEPGDRYSRRYSALVNPTIATEFSTAAFRVGHTLLQGELQLRQQVQSPPGDVSLAVNLRDVFFDPSLIYDGRLGEFAIGMITQPPQKCDVNIAEDLTEFLFQEEGHAFGLDLISLNIQRGRDHGIATYNTMREWVGLGRADSFGDLLDVMDDDVVARLQQVYNDVDDIDLFIGAISERVAPGAAVGHTIRIIVGDQFARLRWGDNRFYDLGGPERPWRFKRRQLREIKRATWARILCDNIGGISEIQARAFEAACGANPIQPCASLPQVNLNAWRPCGQP